MFLKVEFLHLMLYDITVIRKWKLFQGDIAMAVNYDSQEYLKSVDAYWRAANYLSVGQLFLMNNPLL